MFSQLSKRSHKLLLWLLALALLTFAASMFPEIRRLLPWFHRPPGSGEHIG